MSSNSARCKPPKRPHSLFDPDLTTATDQSVRDQLPDLGDTREVQALQDCDVGMLFRPRLRFADDSE